MKPVQNRFPPDPNLGRLKNEKPPLFFVPNRMLCYCGQNVMVSEEGHTPPDLYIIVVCTQPFCSEYQKDKKIVLPTFREYEVLPS